MESETSGTNANLAAAVQPLSRRQLLSSTAALGALAVAPHSLLAEPQTDRAHDLGLPRRPYGDRSPYEKNVVRSLSPNQRPSTGSAHTPLQDLFGIITPSALHYEVVHFGVPAIDPARHELLIDGLVDQPLILSMKDLERSPLSREFTFLNALAIAAENRVALPVRRQRRATVY